VELLLAITLMSMLLGLAYGGLRAATRATDRGQVILEQSSRLRMAHQFIRKQLTQMLPLAFAEAEDGVLTVSTVFEGTATRIRYVSPMPGYLGFGGPQVQELAITSTGDGLALVLSHALLQGFEEERMHDRAPIMLIDGIEQAEFNFQGRDEEGELAGWVNQWDDPGVLPVVVSLDIEFEEGAYTEWPILVAAVKIDSASFEQLDGSRRGPASYSSAIKDLIQKRRERD
jgi:general secretion pathway protein J